MFSLGRKKNIRIKKSVVTAFLRLIKFGVWNNGRNSANLGRSKLESSSTQETFDVWNCPSAATIFFRGDWKSAKSQNINFHGYKVSTQILQRSLPFLVSVTFCLSPLLLIYLEVLCIDISAWRWYSSYQNITVLSFIVSSRIEKKLCRTPLVSYFRLSFFIYCLNSSDSWTQQAFSDYISFSFHYNYIKNIEKMHASYLL